VVGGGGCNYPPGSNIEETKREYWKSTEGKLNIKVGQTDRGIEPKAEQFEEWGKDKGQPQMDWSPARK